MYWVGKKPFNLWFISAQKKYFFLPTLRKICITGWIASNVIVLYMAEILQKVNVRVLQLLNVILESFFSFFIFYTKSITRRIRDGREKV